jgi:GH25 family lysozyme M1 (1,4-beta-N-acetylmuramidase)
MTRPHARPSLALLAVALLSAMFLFSVSAVANPGAVLGATSTKVAACGANLRVNPWTTAKLKGTVSKGTRVTVTTNVSGGKWKARCAGEALSGHGWWRISAINGKSVKSLYGVRYVYAARKLFKAVAPPIVTKYAACSVRLRTSPSTDATREGIIDVNARVSIAATVSGGGWNTTCAGAAVSGSSWYRITAVDGTSVQTLYGVGAVYAASGLFKATITTQEAPTPTPSGSTTPTPTPTPAPLPTPLPGTTEGIDISHWQGTINWTKVAGAGKRFAYMKASEDTWYVDPTYQTNRAQANANGLLVGAYHFSQPNATIGSATAQADHFLDTATPASGDLLPVLDLERTGGLGQNKLIAWVQEYMARIYERTGVQGVIYCSPNFWRTNMGDTTWFSDNGYDVLWVAHWTTATTPIVPGGAWGGDGWTFWQYTSDGSVPGISGRVDLNRYNGTNFSRVRIP